MAYKNWERNYHAVRKGYQWVGQGFMDYTWNDAWERNDIVGEIERKKILSAGGYPYPPNRHGKHIFNRRMRVQVKKHNKLVLEGFQDEADSIFMYKNRRYRRIIE